MVSSFIFLLGFWAFDRIKNFKACFVNIFLCFFSYLLFYHKLILLNLNFWIQSFFIIIEKFPTITFFIKLYFAFYWFVLSTFRFT